MSMSYRFLATLTGALVVLSAPAHSQPTSEDDVLRSSVLVAVAQALGADPSNLPDYQTDLQTARRAADTASLCGTSSGGQFLTPEVANKVVARAVDLVKQKNPSLWERPRYVRDLIVVSAVSFEAGRLAATSKEYRESLAASAPVPSNCKGAAQ